MSPSPRTKMAVRLGILAVASALALSACGSSDSSGGSAGDTPSKTPTGEPITIGVASSQTGPQAFIGIAAKATSEAWAKTVNAAGGIGGRPIKLVQVDTKSNAAATQAAVKGLIADDKVVAILLSDLVTEIPILTELNNSGIAFLSGEGAAGTVWNAFPNVFQPNASTPYMEGTPMGAAGLAGGTAIANAACSEAASCVAANKFLQPLAEAAGVRWAGYQTISSTAPNYTAECLSFLKQKPDVIALNLGADTAVRVMQDCLTQGYTGRFSLASPAFDQSKVSKVPGAKVLGTLTTFPWWADNPGAKEFVKAMEKYSPGASYTTSVATGVWSTLKLLEKQIGASDTKTVTRQSVIDAMYAVKDEKLGGLLAKPVTFTAGEPSPVNNCVWGFEFNAGDKAPTTIAPKGESGNGETGDLASFCVDIKIGQ